MRHISQSTHLSFCRKLENIEIEPDLVNNQIIFEQEVAEELTEDKKRLEDLFYNYQERLRELALIQQEYYKIQQQARVKLRRQQVKNNTRVK
jgi:hypothetical protein